MVWKQRQEEEPVEEQPCWRLLLSSVSAGFGLAPGRRAYWLLALRLLKTNQFMKLKVGSRIIPLLGLLLLFKQLELFNSCNQEQSSVPIVKIHQEYRRC